MPAIPQLDSPIAQVLLDPFLKLLDDINNLTQRRRVVRHSIHGTLLLAAIGIGIFLPHLLPAFGKWLASLGSTFAVPAELTPIFQCTASAWITATPTSWLANKAIDVICKASYGDTLFYLKQSRAIELAKSELDYDELDDDLDPEILNDAIEHWQKIFKFIVGKLRAPGSETGARDEDLIEVLELFMFGNIDAAIVQFNEQERLYNIHRWQQGKTDNLFEAENLNKLSELFKFQGFQISPSRIETVLHFCLAGLQASKSLPGARKEDYIEIMEDILSGNIKGFQQFEKQQTALLQARLEIMKHHNENAERLAELRKRRAAQQAATPELALSPMTPEYLQPLLPQQEPSPEELQVKKLIKDLGKQQVQQQLLLDKMPRPAPEQILTPTPKHDLEPQDTQAIKFAP